MTSGSNTVVEYSTRIPKIEGSNTNSGGRLSIVDLLIKVACFVKKENNIFNIKTAHLN